MIYVKSKPYNKLSGKYISLMVQRNLIIEGDLVIIRIKYLQIKFIVPEITERN